MEKKIHPKRGFIVIIREIAEIKKTAEIPRNEKKTQNISITSAYWTVFNC